MQLLRPLRRPALRRFLLASLISSAGTGMSLIAGKLYVREATGSNLLVGLLGAVGFSAGIVAVGRLGTLIDRHDRRRVMVGADLYRLVLALVVPLALLAGVFRPGLLFPVVFLMGFGHTVGYPNLSAMVGDLVPDEERPAVNGLIEICMQVGMMGGAACSGWIYRAGGVGLVYGVDAGTFATSALLFATMTGYQRRDEGEVPERAPGESEFAQGWRYLRERPALLLYGVAAQLPWVATMSLNTVLPGLIEVRLGGGPIELGVMDAAYSLGGVLAGALGGLVLRRLGTRLGMALTLGAGALAVGGLAWTTSIAPALGLALGFGLGNSSFRVIHRTFVLRKIPNQILGRVLSFYAWAGLCGSAVGMVAAGRAMDHWGEVAGVGVLLGAELAALGLVLVLGARGFLEAPATAGSSGPAASCSPSPSAAASSGPGPRSGGPAPG